MKWNNLPEDCKECDRLRCWSLDMGGNSDYACHGDPSCKYMKGWYEKERENKKRTHHYNKI